MTFQNQFSFHRIHDLEHTNKLLEHDNKRMSKDVDKLSKSLRDMIPLKEHEEVVANFRNTIKKVKIAFSR